ncbi:probable 2-ketogluconate reductase [Amphiura filiformis]|uniref:probable 2-ketogluconate reductase n=1 Tax=Amphiura filiformis TaxID=82378 RepID=UPI003B21C574
MIRCNLLRSVHQWTHSRSLSRVIPITMEIPYILSSKELLRIKKVYDDFQKHFQIIFVEDLIADTSPRQKQLYQAIQGIQLVTIAGNKILPTKIKDENFISSLPNLKILSYTGVGRDHLDLPMLHRHGIVVANSGAHDIVNNTVEFGFGLMLTLARNIHTGMHAYLNEDFDWCTYLMVNSGSLLMDSMLGIVGMGRIGYQIAERAAAFKMKIVYHNRTQRSKEDEELVNAKYCQTLNELLRMSDHVMLAVPLSDKTKRMIGARELKLMKPNAAIINISRGAVIDQDALIEALNNHTIQGAALDVTTPEPLPPDHPLLKMSNVIVTPHAGGNNVRSFYSKYQICLENIKAAIEGRPVQNEIK